MYHEYTVRGESMRDTLPTGTTITVDISPCSIAVGDLVVVKLNDNLIVKRIVLGPGDSMVEFERYPILKAFSEQWSGVLPNEHYLIQGDVPESFDSTRFGPINTNDIVGRVVSYA